jgi:hypothetical protein
MVYQKQIQHHLEKIFELASKHNALKPSYVHWLRRAHASASAEIAKLESAKKLTK